MRFLLYSCLLALLACSCRAPLPTTPEAPAGPETLGQGATGEYRLWATPEKPERFRFLVNWGDHVADTTAFARGGDTVRLSHAWSDTGTYAVFCRTQDEEDRLSEPSPSLSVTVINFPPATPAAVWGPDTARQESLAEFRTVTTDPERDRIDYTFDWGDGTSTSAPGYASGDSARMLHFWATTGDYSVRVRARDSNGHETGWSAPHPVVVIP
jgi:hypothetical protein